MQVCYAPDGAKIVSGSSDGSVRVWDAKSCECVCTFAPPTASELSVQSVTFMPGHSDHLLICNRSPTVRCPPAAPRWPRGSRPPSASTTSANIGELMPSQVYVMTLGGQLVQSFASGRREGGDLVGACLSSQGGWAHCIGEDGHVYEFDVKEGKLAHLLKVHEKGPIGVTIHPHRNLLATWSDEGVLKLWRANE